MDSHTSSLQDVVSLTIRRMLEGSERRFKRVTMSHDAAGLPAEIYGADGKIYYRKAGGVGEELGVAGSGLWESNGGVTSLVDPEPIRLEDDVTFHGDHIINWKDPVTADLVGSIYAFDGAVQRDFMIKTWNSGILTLDSAAGYIACSGDRLSDVGTPSVGSDAATKAYADGIGGGTFDHAALTSHMDFASCGHSGFAASSHNHAWGDITGEPPYCTRWPTWSEVTSKPDILWQSYGTPEVTSLIVPEHINLQDKCIYGIDYLSAYDGTGIVIRQSDATSRILLAPTGKAFVAMADADMNTNKITGLVAGDAAGQAVEYDQLAGYLPLSGGMMAGDIDMGNWGLFELAYIVVYDNAEGLQLWDSSGLINSVKLGNNNYALECLHCPIHMHSHDILEIKDLQGRSGNNDWVFYGGNSAGGVMEMLRWDALAQNINAANRKIADLGQGSAPEDAARISDISAASKITKDSATVECMTGGDIDITVPAGKVVTFIRG